MTEFTGRSLNTILINPPDGLRLGHVEGRRGLAGVVDDEVVDVIVVYDVRHVTVRLFSHDSAALQVAIWSVLAVVIAHGFATLLKAFLLVLQAVTHFIFTLGQ